MYVQGQKLGEYRGESLSTLKICHFTGQNRQYNVFLGQLTGPRIIWSTTVDTTEGKITDKIFVGHTSDIPPKVYWSYIHVHVMDL